MLLISLFALKANVRLRAEIRIGVFGHPFGEQQIIGADIAARVKQVPVRPILDILQRILGVRAGAPDAGIAAVGLVRDLAPDHGHPL